jgi:hypothetical protein
MAPKLCDPGIDQPQIVLERVPDELRVFQPTLWFPLFSFEGKSQVCTRSDAIRPKTKLLISFCYFAGGGHLDLIQVYRIGRTMCYATCIQKILYAVLKNHEFGQPTWLILDSEVQTYASDWEEISGVPG